MNRKISFIILAILMPIAAMAQLTKGKIYNLKNVANSDKSMAITGVNKLNIATTDVSDYSQLWYVDEVGGAYTLKNLMSGKYLRSSNATSALWTMVDEVDANCKFNIANFGGSYSLRASNSSNSYGYMHYGASQGYVVCWCESEATKWIISEVALDPEVLANNTAILDGLQSLKNNRDVYQEILNEMFADAACTEMSPAYAAMSVDAIKATDKYKTLPTELQEMVIKVRNDSWGEANADNSKEAWDAEYAKKYRVQLYEPYNEPEVAAGVLGVNAHTNLNNPTGIYSSTRSAMYVMVKGEIMEGAELYLSYYVDHEQLGGYNDAIPLREGLNVVPVYSANSNYCINYTVHTFDGSKKGTNACIRKLSDYPSLKIHIEGGHINGYWNKMGDKLYRPDTDADWNYIEARATQEDVVVLGEYMTLKFPLLSKDADDKEAMSTIFNEQVKVSESIQEWDNMMMWQRFVMGLSTPAELTNRNIISPYSGKKVFESAGDDYSDYYNVHGLAISIAAGSNPHAGWSYTGYPNGGMVEYNKSILTSAGAHWTAAHEIGHQHQKLLTMRGLTEVTNNLFANATLWCFGKSTSRYNGTDGALSNVYAAYSTEGGDFFTNNIWAQTQMYYKLFLYYHVLGHNTQFYPRLFEMLRQDPMEIGYEQSGETSLLHFYKKCCLAAEEDLTEFFRAHGFLTVMKNRFVGDYSNANYNMTQVQINKAIAEIKAEEFPENIAVLFINDATGEDIMSHKGGTLELYGETKVCAEVGSYHTFGTVVTPNYTYALNGRTITMQGEGGVGFAVYNEKGEIIAFSDNKTFTVSAECAEQIRKGILSIKAVSANGTDLITSLHVMTNGTDTDKYNALGVLLDVVKGVVDYCDETQTKVGYYYPDVIADLSVAYGNALDAYSSKESHSYRAVYETLNAEYTKVLNNTSAQIVLQEGNAYRLVNKAYPTLSMSINDNKIVIGEETEESSDSQLWYFEQSGTSWYVKNKATETYAKSISTSSPLDASATTTQDATAYVLQNLGNGLFALVGNTGMHCSQSQEYQVVGWGIDSPATQWYITAVDFDDSNELKRLISQSEALMAEIGEVVVEKVTLDENSYFSNAECKNTQYGDQFTSYSVLCDDDISTYFHSDYSNQAPEENHYIRMDVGENNKLQYFALNYHTRKDNNICAPTHIVVEGSNDTYTWTTIKEIISGLPTGANKSYTSEPLLADAPYRYIRFRVVSSNGNNNRYFVLSELGLSSFKESLDGAYSSIQSGLFLLTAKAVLAAENAIAASADLMAVTTALQTAYDNLLDAKQSIDDAALEAKKAELSALIEKTTELANMCGEIVPSILATKVALQTTDDSELYYLSTNAPEPKEGDIANLLDEDNNSFFHSAWSTDINQVHHLMVHMSDEDIVNDFTFSYQCYKGPFPYEIKVYGATDEEGEFTLFKTFSKDDDNNPLPTQANTVWSSDVIDVTSAYRYLRFDVTNSGAFGINATPKGEYCFEMSQFGITLMENSTNVVLNGKGTVTEELFTSVCNEIAKAQAAHDYLTDIELLQNAIDDLQNKYDELYTAAYSMEVSIGSTGYASLYTAVALTLPEDLEAYAAKEVKGNYLILEEKQGIAAEQGAILIGTPGVTYTLVPGIVEADWSGNLLKGTSENTYVAGNAYVLSAPNGEVGLYKATLNKDAEGNVGTTHFLNNGGKAYLPASVVTASVRMLSFDFGGETGIDEVENENGKVKAEIFDLSGRRVQNVQKGLYIVNGKKVIK